MALLTGRPIRAPAQDGDLAAQARGVVERYRRGGRPHGVTVASERLAPLVDHTLLRRDAETREIETLCEEALRHRFAAVCVYGDRVPRCAERLAGSTVRVASVVGFPHGALATAAKTREAEDLIAAGADELDMVAAIERLRDGDWTYVAEDIGAVVAAAQGRLVKVILETAALQPFQVAMGALLAQRAGAGFVKTSTGMHPAGGASLGAVTLLHLAVGGELGVKAAGGVRDCRTVLALLGAGATRIGTSSAVGLVTCLDQTGVALPTLVSDPERHAPGCTTAPSEREGLP